MKLAHPPCPMVLFAGFLAISSGASAAPLDSWTSVSSGTSNRLNAVASGNGIFVAAGDLGTILTSANGSTWISATSAITNSLLALAYGQGQFVAVGTLGAILTSSNGLNWSPQDSGTPNRLNAVASTQLGLVAVGDLGTILTSADGSNWNVRTSGTASSLVGVSEGFGKIIAAANTTVLVSSTNGLDWTTNAGPYFFAGLAYGNGVMLGITIRSGFERSVDGVTWNRFFGQFNNYCYGLTYARNVFIGVGGYYSGGGGRTIATSTNGMTWNIRYTNLGEGRLLSVAYGGHRFVAVGDGGAILVSAPLLSISNPVVVSNGVQMIIEGDPDGVYRIQRSPSLSAPSWDNIGAVTNFGGSSQFVTPILPEASASFYRLSSD